MPYIKPKDRKRLDMAIADLTHRIQTEGELNYTICQIMRAFIYNNELCYNTLNTIIGVLECAKLEIYHKVVRRYEDEKIFENGDVF